MNPQGIDTSFCALLRPVSRPHRHARSTRRLKTGAMSRDVYLIAPRITYVDRAILRSHFDQPPERCILARAPRMRAGRPWRFGGQLPADLHAILLPADLEAKLSPLPLGYERIRVKGDVLLIETESRTVIDAIYSAAGPE